MKNRYFLLAFFCLTSLAAFGLVMHLNGQIEETRTLLLDLAQTAAKLRTDTREFAQSVGQVLQLIVSTQEYQFT